jgi:5-hydroxyisourate hydrolase-like protein (transthyretin family)
LIGTKRAVQKVELDGVDPKAWKLFLEFIYNDETGGVNEENVYDVLSLAMIYPIERLQAICQHILDSETEIPSSKISIEFTELYNNRRYSDITFVFPAEETDDLDESTASDLIESLISDFGDYASDFSFSHHYPTNHQPQIQ